MDIDSKNRIPYDLQLVVERELRVGEEIKWVGRPKTRRVLLQASIFIIFFAVLGGWFIYFGINGLCNIRFMPARNSERPFFWLACILMLLAGLGLLYLSGRSLRGCTRIIYVITNERAILVFTPKKVESFGPSKLTNIRKRLHRDGTGDLLFAKNIYYGKGGWQETEYGFGDIEEVDKVESLLRSVAYTTKTE